jgi:hypothetical protein
MKIEIIVYFVGDRSGESRLSEDTKRYRYRLDFLK